MREEPKLLAQRDVYCAVKGKKSVFTFPFVKSTTVTFLRNITHKQMYYV